MAIVSAVLKCDYCDVIADDVVCRAPPGEDGDDVCNKCWLANRIERLEFDIKYELNRIRERLPKLREMKLELAKLKG